MRSVASSVVGGVGLASNATAVVAALSAGNTIAADGKHLGARIGATLVLHTWGSALTHHPHIHMIVPGGGISLDAYVLALDPAYRPATAVSPGSMAKKMRPLAESVVEDCTRTGVPVSVAA